MHGLYPVVNFAPLPLVSVYIATRNRSRLLSRAIESVRRQDISGIEIVVVDDASDDDTPELLDKLAQEGALRWFRQEIRRGACAARNRALREARGRFVAGLDDDDEMLPDRIGVLLKHLRDGDAFVCASDWILASGSGRSVRLVPARIDRASILSRNVVGNQILAERSKILECGGFDELLPAAQDYDLWIRMIHRHGPARGVRRPLQNVHMHTEGARISRSASRRAGYWAVYCKHREGMSRECRRAHLYNLRRANGHATKLPRDLRYYTPRNRLRMVWHALHDLVFRKG